MHFLLLLSIAADGQTIAPAKTAEPFPTAAIWTIEVSARPVAPPVSSADKLFLALQSVVSARRLTDGTEVWHAALEVDGPMAVSADRVVVSAKGELHVLDAATGAPVWTDRVEP